MDPYSTSWTIGIDLGGTKIKAALVDPDAVVRHSVRRPTDVDDGADAVVKEIAEMVAELRGMAEGHDIAGVGIGVAGQVDADTGIVRLAPNLDWHDYPLQERLHDALDLPVAVVNDVRAATYGEWQYGAGKGAQDLVCIFVGTGVGGGVVTNGHLMSGAANSAGELGHTTVDLHGPQCRCPNHGCLEAYAGGWAIASRAKALVRADHKSGRVLLGLVDGRVEEITGATVSEAFRRSDPLAVEIIDEAVEALVAGCVTFVNAFSPRRIIFGGGVIEGLPQLIARVEQGVRSRALPIAAEALEIVKAALGEDAGVIGAAGIAGKVQSEKEGNKV